MSFKLNKYQHAFYVFFCSYNKFGAIPSWRGQIRLESTKSSSHPIYNYGLQGVGKSAKEKRVAADDVKPKGEILFGIHPTLLALCSTQRQNIYTLFLEQKYKEKISSNISQIQSMAQKRSIEIKYVSKNTLLALSCNRPHQGVCLDASERLLPEYDPQQIFSEKCLHDGLNPLWLLLYNVQDPMNYGAILRSSYFFNIDRVIVPSVNSCAASPVVSKASAGALEAMDLWQLPNRINSVPELLKNWQKTGGMVAGTAAQADSSRSCCLHEFVLRAPTLLIIGNEGTGIEADLLDMCNVLLKITPPSTKALLNGVESLNVSVATGILLHWLQTSRIKS